MSAADGGFRDFIINPLQRATNAVFGQSSRGSLRTRLALLFGGVLLCGGGLLLALANNFAHRSAEEAYDKLLASAALTAMDNLTVREGSISFDLPYASLATLELARDDRVVYSLVDDKQKVLTGYDNTPWPEPADMQVLHRQGKPYFYTDLYQGESFRFVILERQLLEAAEQGKIWLQMGQSQLARRELARDLTLKSLLGITGLIVLGGIFVWLAVGWSVRPLLEVESELLARKPTELNPLTTQVPQEVSHLVQAINRFMGRLQRNQDRNHAFIAEAAHQLRTPLASLQAQAELASEIDDPAVFRDKSERILRNARETNNRITQLLHYATLAHRADVLIPEQLQLADVVSECLSDMVPIAVRESVELGFDNTVGDVSVVADPEAIRELVRNLIDNALKHGQQQTDNKVIHVSLSKPENNDGHVVLQVRDFGPGLDADLLNEVKQRFGRGEFHQDSGSGLGLAIVEQVVHAMGGRLELENGKQGGLKAKLYFRVSEA